MRNDFSKMVKNRSVYLPNFLDKLFYVSSQASLPKFGIPLGRLPFHHYETTAKILPDKFLKTSQVVYDQSQEVLIEFKLLPFPIDMISGSSGSLEVLKNIYSCPNRQIYRSEIVQILITSRWKKFIWFIALLTFIN